MRQEGQPEALRVWLSKGKEYGSPPSSIQPISGFINDLISYYRTLQPPSRLKVWKFDDPFCPFRTVPDDPKEWKELLKGGPYGFFILLLGASWARTCALGVDDSAKLEGLVCDLVWTMKTLVELKESQQPTNEKAKGKENVKRKAKDVENDGRKKKKPRQQ